MSTHIAIFINTPVGDSDIQTVLIPDYSTTTCLFRESSGSRGRGSAWATTDISNVITDQTRGDKTSRSAFLISDKDLAALNAGIATTVGVKALATLSNPVSNETGLHADIVSDTFASMVSRNTTDLYSYLAQGTSVPSIPPLSQVVLAGSHESATIAATTRVTVAESLTDLASALPVTTVAPSLVAASPRMELATVPDKKWATDYINRKVLNNLSEFDIYDQALEDNANVLISGHAGSGKTMSVMAYAAARDMRFYSVSAHAGIEISQVFGKYNPTSDGHFAWTDGGLTDCVRNGNAVLLFNEVNFLPERFTTVIFSLLDARREITLMDKDGEVVRAANNLLIVGDMNPNYRGTRQMNQAWKDRFSQHSIEFPYDPAIEAKLIPNKGLLDMANQLRLRFDKEEISTPISTRSLVAFHKNTLTLGLDYAIYAYLNLFSDLTERNAVSLVIESQKSNIEGGIK
jgi:hypothetical protein